MTLIYVRYVKSTDAKPASAVYIFLLKFEFFSCSYIYVQLFHLTCIEKDIYIAIKVKLLEIFNPLKIQRAVPPAGHLVVTG